MTVYQALALSAAERRQVLEKSAFLGGIGTALSNAVGGWGKDSTGRGYLQRKLMDPVWNAGASGVKSIANDAANAAKGMHANARTAVDNGIDKGLNFVDQNISKPMQQAGQAVVQGAQNLGNQAVQAGQQVVQGAQNLGNQAIQGAQNLGQQAGQAVQQGAQQAVQGAQSLGQQAVQGAKNLGNQAIAGAQNLGDQALDAGLNFVDQNVSRPIFGNIGRVQNAFNEGMARHGNAYLPQQAPQPAPAPQPTMPQLAGTPQ